MIRYAVIPKADAPDPLPIAPVTWEFTLGDVKYIGLEWGELDIIPVLDGWLTFETPEDFQKWTTT